MEWNIDDIEVIVASINTELSNGRTMTGIEKEDFNVNARVIHKRLLRLGYKKINNQYTKEYNETIINSPVESKKIVQEQCNKEIKEPPQNHIKVNEPIEKLKVPIDVDINKLKELTELLEPIKELLRNDKVSIKSNKNKLDIPVITEVKQRTVKVDKDILKQWDKFVKKNSNYKAQDLISQALKEFMNNYQR